MEATNDFPTAFLPNALSVDSWEIHGNPGKYQLGPRNHQVDSPINKGMTQTQMFKTSNTFTVEPKVYRHIDAQTFGKTSPRM